MPNENTTLPKLEHCPFCGSGALFQQADEDDWGDRTGGEFIECIVCKVSTPLMFSCGEDVKPKLAEKWNRRAS